MTLSGGLLYYFHFHLKVLSLFYKSRGGTHTRTHSVFPHITVDTHTHTQQNFSFYLPISLLLVKREKRKEKNAHSLSPHFRPKRSFLLTMAPHFFWGGWGVRGCLEFFRPSSGISRCFCFACRRSVDDASILRRCTPVCEGRRSLFILAKHFFLRKENAGKNKACYLLGVHATLHSRSFLPPSLTPPPRPFQKGGRRPSSSSSLPSIPHVLF